ncbi:MAG: DNA-binding response regulator [Alphaproteobacteria bacterium]|nr:MAG: DNA-binding response regulator [Alphaproteobacteria bacterium]
MSVKRILLVDDDEDLRHALAEQLALHEEFEPSEASTASEGIERARESNPDMILLDVGLPDIDGREACRMLRRAGIKVPIIMLTGADTDADTILGLESGANDYVTKPFRFGVLLARMRAHLRQHEQSEDAVFQVGPYVFKPAAKLLLDEARGAKIRLTEKETAILKYLYRANGKAVSREELLNEVWGYNAGVTTHTLETHVYRLRQKMEENPSDARVLRTEPGGYRLEIARGD